MLRFGLIDGQALTFAQVGALLGISRQGVHQLEVRALGTEGTVEPRAHGGGRVAKLSVEQEQVRANLVAEDNEAILVELCARLEQQTGVSVSRATMGRIVKKLKLTRKKNSSRNGARNREGTAVASAILA